MKYLDKKLYYRCINDTDALKALALFVFVKQRKRCSVFPDYSIDGLSKFCKLSKNTTRKRLRRLEEMGLVCRVGRYGQHLMFKKARRKHENVRISKIHFKTIKDIELALRVILICEIQSSKIWLEQRVFEAYGQDESIPYDVRKRSIKICRKCGVSKFTDNGISWKTISKRLNCSYCIVRQVLEFGEKFYFFKINRNIEELEDERTEILRYSGEKNLFISKRGRIFRAHCNTFTLLPNALQTN